MALVQLEAALVARRAVGEPGAQELQLVAAGLLHGVLEVTVLGHAHLRVEQRGAALTAELLPLLLEAAEEPWALHANHQNSDRFTTLHLNHLNLTDLPPRMGTCSTHEVSSTSPGPRLSTNLHARD